MDDISQVQDAAREALISAFAAVLRKAGKDLASYEKAYLNQILEDLEPEELPDLSAADLNRAVADFWAYGADRTNVSQTLRRIRPFIDAKGQPTDYDVVEIVQADQPFIVETVMGELIDQGLSVRSMFHPVVNIWRDGHGRRQDTDGAGKASAESMMLIFIERVNSDKHATVLAGIDESLNDLKLAVLDFPRMQRLLAEEITDLEALQANAAVQIDPALLAEDIAFLKWLDENRFVFIGARGYQYPRNPDGSYAREEPLNQYQEGYGILRDAGRGVLRRGSEPAVLTQQVLDQLVSSEPVTVAKANIKSRVHRRVYMDYIGIKRYGADGKPAGEVRFVGLFTAEAYDRPVFEVPLIRRKAERVLAQARTIGLNGGHNEKRLKNIIETYPRDELFQMQEADLLRIARGILHLSDRPRVRLFTRNDPFDRFISVLLYIPRELYQSQMQKQAGEILARAYLGRVSASYPYISESLLSCVHYIIGVTPGDHFDPDINDLETDIENIVRSWPQKIDALVHEESFMAGLPVTAESVDWLEWGAAFPVGYQERYDVPEAVLDTVYLSRLNDDQPVDIRAYQRLEDSESAFCFKLYTRGERAIPLSDILPVLDYMGCKTLEEYGFNVRSAALGSVWVHEFIIQLPDGHAGFDSFRAPFEETVLALWRGQTENDGFNALTLAGLGWRDVALLRTLSRYRIQTGLDPAAEIQQQALRENADVARALLDLFHARFAPGGGKASREPTVADAAGTIEALLQTVASLDHDRVLRRLYLLIQASLRSNFYQDKAYISVKIASRELADLPEPKPYREIFVWSPRVEGVHCRFGPVARGGLRWSDRKDDFRTEVLGLVKAQQVKNAVIVPVGSKGGFYPKRLPKGGAPDAVREEAIRAYKTYLSGLLDLTDNIDAAGKTVPPRDVVCWDAPDPYLVVAADKGTATFSDIANSVSADYGFWLGDAFASGGSVGYDHKAMGITARGAWEAVKRHFREGGKDIQTQTFTCAGVGDMSGDVFGNGMLLSDKTLLVAAFDHRDIFLDPNPDPATSFRERQRMFALPRSSWQDYDKELISKGGGVFPRSQKSIPLSPEIKALLELDANEVSPFDLMQAILKMRVELLYFGGIGTYIKAPNQSHLDVGDKANDAIRVDATEIRAEVIGEGANLGMTQAGRIACAERGVRLNTDAIDNSAGVDCSDHEVNIKILLGPLVAAGQMTLEARDKLLADMTDDVAQHVLRHNYDQTLALSLQQATADQDNLPAQAFMTALEKAGKLNRRVEGLPSNAVMETRRAEGRGLYRPELAVTTAYGKIVLFDDIIAGAAPDDESLFDIAVAYFPKALQGHTEAIRKHRLYREIVATVLANRIVNMAGPSFAERLTRGAGVDVSGLVLAFEATRRLYDVSGLWREIDALDNQAPAMAQVALYQELARFLRRQTYWTARRFAAIPHDLKTMMAPYAEGVKTLASLDAALLNDTTRGNIDARVTALIGLGAPDDLACRIAGLTALRRAPEIIELATDHGKDLTQTAELWFLTGEHFGFEKLAEAAGNLASADPWDRMATRRLIEDVRAEQKAVVNAMMSRMTTEESPQAIARSWEDENRPLIEPLQQMMQDMATGGWSFAKLTIVNATLREWVGKL